MTARRPGRPTGETKTREAILGAARRRFGELGYRRTTLRAIARDAGVDPRLVLHYFGSKDDLFRASVELPFRPEDLLARIFDGDAEGIGTRAAGVIVAMLDEPENRRAVTGLLRAAVSEPGAAASVRALLVERLLEPMARRVGGDRPELRASMVASAVVGLVVARHVVALPALASASAEQLRAAITPVIDHYLLGEWVLASTDPE